MWDACGPYKDAFWVNWLCESVLELIDMNECSSEFLLYLDGFCNTWLHISKEPVFIFPPTPHLTKKSLRVPRGRGASKANWKFLKESIKLKAKLNWHLQRGWGRLYLVKLCTWKFFSINFDLCVTYTWTICALAGLSILFSLYICYKGHIGLN